MESYVSYENLRISTFDLKYIEDMTIENEFNNHATLRLTGILNEEIKDDYIILTNETTPLEVYYEDGETNNSLFCGIITSIKEKVINDVYSLSIEAKTYSYIMDIQKNKRDFQDINMTSYELIETIMKKYPKLKYEINIPNESIGEFVLQYNETDYEFLKRYLSQYNQGITAVMKSDGINLYFGIPELEVKPKNTINNYNIKKDLQEYNDVINNDYYDDDILETDFITYKIKTQEIFDVCQNFEFQEQKLYVRKATYVIESAPGVKIVVVEKN